MIKLFSIFLLLIFSTTTVFAQYFLIGQCLIINQNSGELIYATNTSLINGGQYRFFKPEIKNLLPQPKTYFTPETNIALYSGVNWKELNRCG